MPRKLKAVAVDVTKSGGTQVVIFEVTRHDDGSLSVELVNRQPIKANVKESQSSKPIPTAEDEPSAAYNS